VLDDDDAVRFLLERTQRRRRRTATDDTDARVLAVELGVLALALEQAGAYIVQRRRSLAKYLVEWRSQESRVRGWHDARVMNYPTSVAVTWQPPSMDCRAVSRHCCGSLLGLLLDRYHSSYSNQTKPTLWHRQRLVCSNQKTTLGPRCRFVSIGTRCQEGGPAS
jgi:hypothetical protein